MSDEKDKGSQNPDGEKKGKTVTQEEFNGIYAEMKTAKEENQKLKSQLEKFNADLKSKEEETLKKQGEWKSVAEAKEKEVKALNEKLRDTEVNYALKSKASEMGLVDLDLVGLVERQKIKYEDGKVEGVEEVLKDFQKRKPHLFKTGDSNPKLPNVPQNPPGGTTQFENMQADLLSARTPKERDAVYAKYGYKPPSSQKSMLSQF